MVPTREKVDKKHEKPAYPTLDEMAAQRRDFLKKLGKGALVVTASFAGVSCMGVSTEHANEPDVPSTPGVAPMDVQPPGADVRNPDLGGTGPDVAEPDVWTTAGVAPPEDIHEPTDRDRDTWPSGATDTTPPLPGEAPPPPDIVNSNTDVEDDVVPPIMGDLPDPRER